MLSDAWGRASLCAGVINVLTWNARGVPFKEIHNFIRDIRSHSLWDVLVLQEFCFSHKTDLFDEGGSWFGDIRILVQPPVAGRKRCAIALRSTVQYIEDSFDSNTYACALDIMWNDEQYRVISGHLDSGGGRADYKTSLDQVG